MPTLIIIAGPNGAGKTTFAKEYLAAEDRQFEFVNADEMARDLQSGKASALSEVAAARMMIRRISRLVETGADFVIETTLANLTYAQKIPAWQERGYLVSLAYLRLNSVEDSIARVRKRVEAGGHDIPNDVIRRRFGKSLTYFETIYRPIVDEWYIWESREGAFVMSSSWDGRYAERA